MQLTQGDFLSLIFILTIWYAFNPTPQTFSPPGGGEKNKLSEKRYIMALSKLPPGALFGIMWFILYGLISLSLFYFWREAHTSSQYTVTLLLFIANLFTNKLYTPIFFGLRSPVGGMVVLVLTIISAGFILLYIGLILGAASASFWLFVPYMVWLLVALGLHIKFLSDYNAFSDEEITSIILKESSSLATKTINFD